MAGKREIFEAIRSGDDQGLRVILAAQPELAQSREHGISALMLALYHKRTDLADAILSTCPELDIFEAAALGEREIVLELLRSDKSLAHSWSADGYSPLHLACFFDHAPMAKRLLERGVDVSAVAQNSMGVRPLHSAVAGRSRDSVRALLDAGADANATQAGGWTALHGAAQNGDAKIARLLVEHGADLQAKNDDGLTPLDIAKASGHDSVLS